jgi:ATP-dependent helicase HrpA
MNFLVLDEHGRQLAAARDLADLKARFGEAMTAALRDVAPGEDAQRYTGWTFGDLAEIMEVRHAGQTLVGYPALVDAGDAVSLQVFDSPERARALHRAGARRLLAIAFRDRLRELDKSLSRDVALAPLRQDLITAALERTFLAESLPMAQADFVRRVAEGRPRLGLVAQEIIRIVSGILAMQRDLQKKLQGVAKSFPQAAQDVRQQLDELLGPGWLANTPWQRLQHLPRYLRAAALRLEKLRADPARDARQAAELAPLLASWQREWAAKSRTGAVSGELEQFRWLLEELRVQLFAQELKTPVPVSAKRLTRMWHSRKR